MFTEKIEQRNANVQFEIEGRAVYQEMHGGSMEARFRPRTMARERNDERSIRGPGSILCCSNHAHEWVPARKVYDWGAVTKAPAAATKLDSRIAPKVPG
jgi:hypothetical protein